MFFDEDARLFRILLLCCIQCRRRCRYDVDRWLRRDYNNLTFDEQNRHLALTTDVTESLVCVYV